MGRAQQEQGPLCDRLRPAAAEEQGRQSRNSLFSVSCQSKIGDAFVVCAQNGQGWKTVDGQKKYTTFRSGKRVQLQGQDAFIAALADSKPKKKRAKTAPAAAGEETK